MGTHLACLFFFFFFPPLKNGSFQGLISKCTYKQILLGCLFPVQQSKKWIMIQFAPAISLFHSHLRHYVQSYLQRVFGYYLFYFIFFSFNAHFHWLVLFKPTQLLQEKGTYRKNQNNLTVLVIRLSGLLNIFLSHSSGSLHSHFQGADCPVSQ